MHIKNLFLNQTKYLPPTALLPTQASHNFSPSGFWAGAFCVLHAPPLNLPNVFFGCCFRVCIPLHANTFPAIFRSLLICFLLNCVLYCLYALISCDVSTLCRVCTTRSFYQNTPVQQKPRSEFEPFNIWLESDIVFFFDGPSANV